MDLFDLNGKVALVTGSTRGLGETAAKALAKAGADVAVCGRNPADLKRVPAEIQAMGRKSAGFELDVLSKEKVKKGVEQALSYFMTREVERTLRRAHVCASWRSHGPCAWPRPTGRSPK